MNALPSRTAWEASQGVSPCPLCARRDWRPLSDIRANRSVRTDGTIIAAPMGKSHCRGCGLVMRRSSEDLSELYGDAYQLYSNRPGAERFDAGRYTNIADALFNAWGGAGAPARILEVGCSDGSLMQALKARWSESRLLGLEPSQSAVERAVRQNLQVVQGMIGQDLPETIAGGHFDLIYTVHVIEHTPDPAAFLAALRVLLAPGGRIIVTCPDGAIPHAELIHSDHLYTMTPHHLAQFARHAGLAVLEQSVCPAGIHAEHSQLMACTAAVGEAAADAFQGVMDDALYTQQQAYLGQWRGLEAHLMAVLAPDAPLYCFGAGGWTANIAGYCPELWAKVVACAVDGVDDPGARVHGKPISDYAAMSGEPRQFLIVVNPALQARLAARLTGDGHTVIPWPEDLQA